MTSQGNETPEEQEVAVAIAKDRRWFGVGIVMFILVVGIVGGIVYFQRTQNTQRIRESDNQITREPEKSEMPVAQAQASYKIEILNGSGVTGAAKAAEAALKSQITNSVPAQAGQILELDVTTGNAAAQTGDSVAYKSEQLKRSSLAGILQELYADAKVSVDGEQESDVVITLGK